ncbi:MAG: 8-oxo-dGTP pyrophosphatase MutT (NUDIX family), partial [Glaciecola sp.]
SAEKHHRLQTLRYLDGLRSPMDEFADPTHVTSSAIVCPSAGPPAIVLHKHKRLGIWLQPGGHVDEGESVPEAGIREVREETGLVAEHAGGQPLLVHIDVHEGPRGHVHLDTRWLLLVEREASFSPAEGESTDVAWFEPEAAMAAGDVGMAEAIKTSLAHLARLRLNGA